MSALADLKAMNELVARQASSLAYLVLDHAMSPTEVRSGRDGRGRFYARCSPSLLDMLAHAPRDEPFDPDRIVPKSLTGVPVYKREDLPDEWPDA